jgi:hypothetical protein
MGDLAKKADDEVELYIRKRMGFFGFALGVALYFSSFSSALYSPS